MIESREQWLQRIREARKTSWNSNDNAALRPGGLSSEVYVDKATGRTLTFRVIDSNWSETPGESYQTMTLVHNEWNNGDGLSMEEYREAKKNIQELFKPLDCRVRFE